MSKSVFVSVCRLEHSKHLKQDVIMELQGLQGSLFQVSRMFQGRVNDVNRKFQGCFKEV